MIGIIILTAISTLVAFPYWYRHFKKDHDISDPVGCAALMSLLAGFSFLLIWAVVISSFVPTHAVTDKISLNPFTTDSVYVFRISQQEYQYYTDKVRITDDRVSVFTGLTDQPYLLRTHRAFTQDWMNYFFAFTDKSDDQYEFYLPPDGYKDIRDRQ